jgi:hypothetical protein
MSEATAETTTVENDPVEDAAKAFVTLAPDVSSRIGAMASKSGKGLARVVSAAIQFPFAEEYPRFKNQDESTLFMMMLQLNELRTTLSKAFEKDMPSIQGEVVNKAVNDIMEKELNKTKEEKTNE